MNTRIKVFKKSFTVLDTESLSQSLQEVESAKVPSVASLQLIYFPAANEWVISHLRRVTDVQHLG
jgi:hypothetical protein